MPPSPVPPSPAVLWFDCCERKWLWKKNPDRKKITITATTTTTIRNAKLLDIFKTSILIQEKENSLFSVHDLLGLVFKWTWI